ncbi:MAG: pilin [Oceanospirillaceae bacterium]|nr:pilin [Oceanospirillaceae bacterium]
MNKYMAAVALSCCFFSSFSIAKTTSLVPDTSVSSITQKPWLRANLPDNTLLYARIPSIWNTLSYKDDSFKYALGNPSFTQSMQKLQISSQTLIESADKKLKPWLNLLIAQINGPIELAVFPGTGMPELLVSASINLSSESDLQLLIDKLKKQRLIRGEAAPLKEGSGLLQANIGNVPYRWDKENNRLNLLVRIGGGTVADLDAKLAGLKPNDNSPMLANEQQMDSSKQGLYVWMNNTLAYPMYKMMLPSQNMAALQMLSVEEIKSVAISAGVRDQKGRLKLQIEAPTTGVIRSIIPTNSNQLDVVTAGEPKVALLLAIPSKEQFAVIESALNNNPKRKKEYQGFNAKLSENFGFEIEDIFAAIGSEFVVVSDDVGEYGLIKIRDEVQFNTILEGVKQQSGVTFESKEIAGIQINYLKFPGLTSMLAPGKSAKKPQLLDQVLNNSSTHLYWQLDGEFLVLASLPQVLIDRQLATEKVNLGQWYKETQRQDISGSTLAISGSIEHAPRRIYYSYIEAMQFLADVSQTQLDTFSLPSAKQLSLAQQGSLGLQIDSTKESLSLELSFESTPMDFLLAAPIMGTFASVGILSAVAIPAYQDYQFKANLASAQFVTQVLKDKVAAAYLSNKQFPNQQLRDEMLLSIEPAAQYRIDIIADVGEILMTFRKPRAKFIKWTPVVNEERIDWQCTSNLKADLRPKQCERASL